MIEPKCDITTRGIGQWSKRVLLDCPLVNPTVFSGYLAMTQLGPMLPSPQDLSRLVCDQDWYVTTLICKKTHYHIPPQPEPPNKESSWTTEVSLSGAHPWVWLCSPKHTSSYDAKRLGSVILLVLSTCEFQPALSDALFLFLNTFS